MRWIFLIYASILVELESDRCWDALNALLRSRIFFLVTYDVMQSELIDRDFMLFLQPCNDLVHGSDMLQCRDDCTGMQPAKSMLKSGHLDSVVPK